MRKSQLRFKFSLASFAIFLILFKPAYAKEPCETGYLKLMSSQMAGDFKSRAAKFWLRRQIAALPRHVANEQWEQLSKTTLADLLPSLRKPTIKTNKKNKSKLNGPTSPLDAASAAELANFSEPERNAFRTQFERAILLAKKRGIISKRHKLFTVSDAEYFMNWWDASAQNRFLKPEIMAPLQTARIGFRQFFLDMYDTYRGEQMNKPQAVWERYFIQPVQNPYLQTVVRGPLGLGIGVTATIFGAVKAAILFFPLGTLSNASVSQPINYFGNKLTQVTSPFWQPKVQWLDQHVFGGTNDLTEDEKRGHISNERLKKKFPELIVLFQSFKGMPSEDAARKWLQSQGDFKDFFWAMSNILPAQERDGRNQAMSALYHTPFDFSWKTNIDYAGFILARTSRIKVEYDLNRPQDSGPSGKQQIDAIEQKLLQSGIIDESSRAQGLVASIVKNSQADLIQRGILTDAEIKSYSLYKPLDEESIRLKQDMDHFGKAAAGGLAVFKINDFLFRENFRNDEANKIGQNYETMVKELGFDYVMPQFQNEMEKFLNATGWYFKTGEIIADLKRYQLPNEQKAILADQQRPADTLNH